MHAILWGTICLLVAPAYLSNYDGNFIGHVWSIEPPLICSSPAVLRLNGIIKHSGTNEHCYSVNPVCRWWVLTCQLALGGDNINLAVSAMLSEPCLPKPASEHLSLLHCRVCPAR